MSILRLLWCAVCTYVCVYICMHYLKKISGAWNTFTIDDADDDTRIKEYQGAQ